MASYSEVLVHEVQAKCYYCHRRKKTMVKFSSHLNKSDVTVVTWGKSEG